MLLGKSHSRRPQAIDGSVAKALDAVSVERLRWYVEMLAFPRNYHDEGDANRRARDLLLKTLCTMGYAPELQGQYDNVVVHMNGSGPQLLLGAHYDSVAGTPGADDNGSAVAVCLECARLLKDARATSATIVFFNLEEDGLLGSQDFVDETAKDPNRPIAEAHIFEMVGYCDRTKGSQRLPPGLPGIMTPKAGDFLGLLANSRSNAIAESLLTLAATYTTPLSVQALKIYFGLERRFADLLRSDHTPFWEAKIPAVMWTDAANFRNPHYHRATDTPETLDYEFMQQVARLALARALTWRA